MAFDIFLAWPAVLAMAEYTGSDPLRALKDSVTPFFAHVYLNVPLRRRLLRVCVSGDGLGIPSRALSSVVHHFPLVNQCPSSDFPCLAS